MIADSGTAMSCNEVQLNLSLYLYGELNFAGEEAVERHLEDCSMCQLALAREKRWHTGLNAVAEDIPASLLAACRHSLHETISRNRQPEMEAPLPRRRLREWLNGWGFSATQWSGRLAWASFFVFVGVAVSHWSRQFVPFNVPVNGQMSVLGAPESRIRDIQSETDGRIRIVVDRLEQQQLVGSANDSAIRDLLMNAARHSADPGLRIDSVELLKAQRGDDIRDALISAVRHDQNAAVRLKALESLGHFAADASTRQTLVYLLEHDKDPGIRSHAIDVLLPPNARVEVGPDLVRALENISQADAEDDYVRARCLQILQAVGAVDLSSGSIY